MAVHTLHRKMVIPASRAQVWAFFSNPRNLAHITPPGMGFSTVETDLPEHVRPGLMITHRLTPLLGIPITWLTEITHVVEGERFVDEQRTGPYAVWHHEHDFHTLGDGGTEMVDRITYVLPFGPLGNLVHSWLVQPQLEKIFAFREKAVREIFPAAA